MRDPLITFKQKSVFFSSDLCFEASTHSHFLSSYFEQVKFGKIFIVLLEASLTSNILYQDKEIGGIVNSIFIIILSFSIDYGFCKTMVH